MAAANSEPPIVDTPPSPNAALADAARAVAARRLGRARLPVEVRVRLNEQLELDGIAVEVLGAAAVEEGKFTDCLRDIVVLLARENKRMTTARISDGLERQGTPYGDTTLKTTLSQAVKDEVLTNRPDSKPPGYGLPSMP